jgi:Cu/Ag efflux pump CusA
MMHRLVDSSLKFRRLIVAAAAGLLITGIAQIGNTKVDVLPEFNPPMVEVQTEALGLSAEEVEQLITVPLEQDLLVGVPFLDEIESVSLPGLSSVVMTFEPGTDILDARQVVQERLTQAVGIAGLPQVAKLPQMIQPLSSSSRVAMVKLSSEQLTPIEVSVLARWVIGPRLMSVPGVANVVSWGNRERQLQVLVDPQRLQENNTTLSEVISTAGNALEVSPLSFLQASKPGTGGFIDTPNQRLNIFHEQAITTPQELAQVPLEDAQGGAASSGGTALALGEVTDVVENHQPLIGDAVCAGGEDCLLLVVEKFPGANTIEVTNGVERALQALRPGLADMQMDSSVYRPASFVESSFANLGWALLAGGLLLLLMLVGALFWDWRRSLVAVVAIGASTSAALLVLQLRDTTVNFMVAAGLVIGLTAVIHDALSDVTVVARRLAERDPEHPRVSDRKSVV